MNGLRQTLAAHGLRLPIFLFLFLPLVLAGYFGLPRRWGNAVLLVSSLCFHIWGEGLYAAIVLSSIAFSWLDLMVRRPPSDTARDFEEFTDLWSGLYPRAAAAPMN
jgi:hypothetical protein